MIEGTDTNVAHPFTAAIAAAPQRGTANTINLHRAGSRLQMAVMRDGVLWTCQHVGLAGTNGSYVHHPSASDVDRSAVQWIKLQTNPGTPPLIHSDHGRIFDRNETENPMWYHFPSLMVNAIGDFVAGFSGSSATNYISALFCWRLANGTTPDRPMLIKAGTVPYPDDRWGDYSATSLDPNDSTTFWTVQQYATDLEFYGWSWGTWIGRLLRKP